MSYQPMREHAVYRLNARNENVPKNRDLATLIRT